MTHSQSCTSFLSQSAGTVVLGAALASCAVETPPQVRTNAGVAVAVSHINLIPPAAEQAQRLQLHKSLKSKLQSKGIAISKDADAIGEVAIASAAGSVGLYASDAESNDENARAIAQTRDPHWLDACKAQRVKASLAVFHISTGELIQRSEVETNICEDKAPPVEQLAELLASEVAGK